MGEAQGKKVDPSSVAAQAIEAQPAFGQIRPSRGQVLARTEQHPWEKTWPLSVYRYERSAGTGVEKQAPAQKRA